MTSRGLKWTVGVATAAVLAFACNGTESNGSASDAGALEAGLVCVSGQHVACVCAGGSNGVQVCNDDGNGFGSCACGDQAITDADIADAVTTDATGNRDGGDGAPGGDSGTAPGTLGWAKAFGVNAGTGATSVAVDRTNGDIALTGTLGAVSGPYHGGSADFGGGVIGDWDGSTGGPSAFIARFDSSGTYEWAHAVLGDVRPRDIAVDGAGNVIVAGAYRGSTDFGDGLVSSVGTQDIFFASFDSSGTLLWEKEFGLAGAIVAVSRMTIDGAGNILVVADPAHAALDLGCGPIAAGNAEVVVKLDPMGNCVWSTPSGGGGTLTETLAVDAIGNVLVGGGYSGFVDVGSGTVSPYGEGPGPEMFLQKWSPSGVLAWVKTYPRPVGRITGIGADASGNILVDGTFCGLPLDLGCGPLTPLDTPAAFKDCGDVFLSKLDPAGACIWSRSFGDQHQQVGGPLVVDDLGGPAITGAFDGNVDFASGASVALDASFSRLQATASPPFLSAYVAKFTSTGAYAWAYSADATGGGMNGRSASSSGTGVSTSGNVVVSSGTFMFGILDLGGHPLTATGQQASWLATFAR